MQVCRPSERSDHVASEVCPTESDIKLREPSEGDGILPRWAAAAVNDEVARSYNLGEKWVCHHSDSDSMLTSHAPESLPPWAARALADKSLSLTSAISLSTIHSEDEISDEPTSHTSLDDNMLSRTGTRATWGPVEPPVVKSQLASAAGSSVVLESGEMTESVCSLSSSVHSDGKESDEAIGRTDARVFPGEPVGSRSDTLLSRPKASVNFVKETASLRDSENVLPLSAATCDPMDRVFDDDLGSEVSEELSSSSDNKPAERLRKSAAYQSVSQESTESMERQHVRTVDNLHVNKETIAADAKRYVKLVPDQFVGSETRQVDDRPHLRMSSSAGVTTESAEVPEHALVKSVEGQRVSAETFGERSTKPCVRMHAERHATKETESTLPVRFASFLNPFSASWSKLLLFEGSSAILV